MKTAKQIKHDIMMRLEILDQRDAQFKAHPMLRDGEKRTRETQRVLLKSLLMFFESE